MTKQVPASSTDPIAYFTLYDPLTGLPNRLLLHEHLSRAIGLARRHKQHVALLSLDLKEFKNRHSPSNIKMDEHELQMLGVFISSCIRASDTVCHLGDSQFVVLLTDIDKPEQSTQVANKLRTAFMDSLSEGGYRLDDTVRIVLSVYPGDGDDAEGLIQHAERALQAGRTAHNTDLYPGRTPYDGPLLSSRLQQAVDNGEFVLYYQPQFNLSTGSVIGAETFIRWLDPDRGLILPHQFMSVAESSGLIMTIGQWVLQQTCWQINAWKAIGMTPLPLSVNLSGEEFRNPHFVKNVASFVREATLAYGDLELEISATVFMEDVERSLRTMNALKTIGIQLAIDCFGIGISSLRYLESLPFDTIKVDRAFLRNIESNLKDATFLRSLIGFGKRSNRRTIVMGVESVEQLRFLQAHQCDGAQGFQLGHPLPADDFAMLLATKRCLPPQYSLH